MNNFITDIFYFLILSLFIFFLYIFLSKKINRNILIKILFAKNKLKEYEERISRYHYIFNNLSDGLAIIDYKKNILFVNRALNKNIRSVKIPADIKEFDFLTRNLELNRLVDSVISNNDIDFIEKKISHFDRAEEKIINCTIFRIGSSNEYAIIIRDITYLQKIENVRAAFIQNISHELKTPITAIMGFVETLKNGAIDNRETSVKFIDIIEHQTKRLNYLIGDLITLANIETGKSPVRYEEIAIKSHVDNSLMLFGKEISGKNIGIDNEVSDITFISDASKINQIITNLIQNAVKYSEKDGAVKLEGFIIDAKSAYEFILNPEGAHVLWDYLPLKENCEKFFFFSIEDRGIGVNYTSLLRLGERFFRAEGSPKDKNKGTGLGLAIAKHTLKLLKGAAVIKSSLGNGFIFSFIIPLTENLKRN